MNGKELMPLKKSIEEAADKAIMFSIKTTDEMKIAVELLSNLNKYKDGIDEKKSELAKPLHEALKNIRAMFRPLEEKYEAAIETLRSRMSYYQTEKKRAADLEAERIAELTEKGTLKVETAVRKMGEIERPEDKVETSAGDVKFREVKLLKIADETRIPRVYLKPDEKLILEALKEGKAVDGCVLEIKQVPVNYR